MMMLSHHRASFHKHKIAKPHPQGVEWFTVQYLDRQKRPVLHAKADGSVYEKMHIFKDRALNASDTQRPQKVWVEGTERIQPVDAQQVGFLYSPNGAKQLTPMQAMQAMRWQPIESSNNVHHSIATESRDFSKKRLSRSKRSVSLSIFASALDVDRHQYGHGRPDHRNEEEERVSDVASGVRNEPNDKRADKRA